MPDPFGQNPGSGRNDGIDMLMPIRSRLTAMNSLIAVGSIALTLLLSGLPLFAFLDLKGLDLLFTLRGASPAPSQVVVVAIDEPSFTQIDAQWPWPRSLHAQLLRQLRRAGARVVGFDLLFAEPSQPTEDQELADALRAAGNAVLASELSIVNDPLFRQMARIDPIPSLREAAAAVGIPNVAPDADGTVRRAVLSIQDSPSFASELTRLYLARTGDSGAGRSPPERGTAEQAVLLDFRGPPRTVQTVSYYQALDFEKQLPRGIFEDKIVLVGLSVDAAPEPGNLTADTFRTPFSWIAETPTSGVEIQASIVSNLLEGRFIEELGLWGRLLLLLLLIVPAGLLLARLRPITALLVTVLLAAAFTGLAFAVFAKFDLWLPLFPSIMALTLMYLGQLLARAIIAERERREALEALNQNLEAQVAERTQALSDANLELQERHQQLETAYQDLTRAQQHLIQSEKMASLGFLVAGVAHELNNPISFVYSNLEFIDEYTERLAGVIRAYGDSPNADADRRRRGDDLKRSSRFDETLDTLQDLIRSCKDGANRVKQIVLDLRTFSRTDDIGLMETDLLEGLESSLSLLATQYRDRISIHRNYASLPWVECFPGQINQVFMNILQNAVQAIPDRGDVWITTTATDSQVVISVRDNGCGISEANLSRVFDPFFTTKPVGMGTGLGLSLSYGIIERHGGRMVVRSRAGEGTEFVVELPIHPKRRDP